MSMLQSNPRPQAYQEVDQVAVGDLARTLWRHRFLLAAALAGCILLAVFALGRMTPTYTAGAQILLDSREQRVLDAGAVLSESALDNATIATAVALIGSRELIAGVVDELGLAGSADLPPDMTQASAPRRLLDEVLALVGRPVEEAPPVALSRAQLTGALRSRLVVRREGASHIIALTFESGDPDFSARVVNAVADAYVESQLSDLLGATRRATAWLETRTAELRADVEEAEAAAARRRAENLALDQSGLEIANQQLADLGGRLTEARVDRLALESRHEHLRRIMTESGVAAASEIISTPVTLDLRGQLLALRREANLLSSRFGAGSPQLRDVEIDRVSIEAALAAEFETHMAGLQSEIAIARDRERSLQDSLRAVEARIVANSLAFTELNQLERDAEAVRGIYETFLIRLNETRAQEAIERTSARVISPATPPAGPSAPRRSLTLAASGVAGVLLGLGLVVARELLRRVYRTSAEAEADLGLPVVAAIPRKRSWSLKELTRRIGAEPHSDAVEELRRLRTALLFSGGAPAPRTVMLTSSARGEGRTTVALALAHLCGLAGRKAIVVEADLRAPAIARAFGWTQGPDIVAALRDPEQLDAAIRRVEAAGFDVLPCGPGRTANEAESAADALSVDALRGLMDRLATRYDVILIDAPPALVSADAQAIGQLADACFYVIRAERTDRALARRGVAALSEAGGFVPRLVMNMARRGA